jgi:hypothetical protein
MDSYDTNVHPAVYLLYIILFWGGFAVAFSGLVFLGYQISLFLWSGEWVSYNFLYLATYLPDALLNWAILPDSWLGIHKILDVLPLSVGLVGVGVLMVVMWVFLLSYYEL